MHTCELTGGGASTALTRPFYACVYDMRTRVSPCRGTAHAAIQGYEEGHSKVWVGCRRVIKDHSQMPTTSSGSDSMRGGDWAAHVAAGQRGGERPSTWMVSPLRLNDDNGKRRSAVRSMERGQMQPGLEKKAKCAKKMLIFLEKDMLKNVRSPKKRARKSRKCKK